MLDVACFGCFYASRSTIPWGDFVLLFSIFRSAAGGYALFRKSSSIVSASVRVLKPWWVGRKVARSFAHPFRMSSHTWCCFNIICTWSDLRLADQSSIAAVLSTSIWFAGNSAFSSHGCAREISQYRFRIQDACLVHADIATYYTSPDDNAITVYIFYFQYVCYPLMRTT